jgi:hypothetical protein
MKRLIFIQKYIGYSILCLITLPFMTLIYLAIWIIDYLDYESAENV